jgi:hypothetical protein
MPPVRGWRASTHTTVDADPGAHAGGDRTAAAERRRDVPVLLDDIAPGRATRGPDVEMVVLNQHTPPIRPPRDDLITLRGELARRPMGVQTCVSEVWRRARVGASDGPGRALSRAADRKNYVSVYDRL